MISIMAKSLFCKEMLNFAAAKSSSLKVLFAIIIIIWNLPYRLSVSPKQNVKIRMLKQKTV